MAELIANTPVFVFVPGDYRNRKDGGFELRLMSGNYLIQKRSQQPCLVEWITTIKEFPENG